MSKAIFIDKDGTLIHNVPYNVNPRKIKLNDGAVEMLASLQQRDYLLIVVSNQAGVAKGYFTEKELMQVNRRINELLLANGVAIDAFYYCPHHPDGIIAEYAVRCDCRKPAPGLLLKAAAEYNIDLGRSWMIGDILHDVEAGKRAGCNTILLNNGNETEWILNKYREPDYTIQHLADAPRLICNTAELLNV